MEASDSHHFIEPKFFKCLPMAKGVCCGLISLRIVLLLIVCIDISIGGAAIGIGVIAFVKYHLPTSLALYVIINGTSFILAIICIYAIC